MAYSSSKKPSALNSASTPLAAGNQIVLDQNGNVVRASLADVEAKVFDSKTALSTPVGTEVVVVRQTDNTLRQVALSDIVPDLNITNDEISTSAAITDTKLATINTAGKVTNNAVQATSANTANRIVTRDGSGNFAAGTITATLSGNASTATTATTATTLITGRTIALTGDVTGTTGAFDGSANVSAATTIADGSVTLAKLVAVVQRALVPPGAVQAFAMNSTPSGWLECNGSEVSRFDYSALFSAIGTSYGSGNGSTTFTLPDLRGYFLRGSGINSDGTEAGTFGAKTADALKTHTHTTSGNTGVQSNDHTHTVSGTTGNDSPDHTHTGWTDVQGNHAHSQGSRSLYNFYGGGIFIGNRSYPNGGFQEWQQQNTSTNGAHSHNVGTNGASANHQHSFSATSSGVSSDHTHSISLISGNPSTGTSAETRPRNIAMLYCIKF
jgi:microcystin-dependent protein